MKKVLCFIMLVIVVISVTAVGYGYSFPEKSVNLPKETAKFLIPSELNWTKALNSVITLDIKTRDRIPATVKETVGWVVGLDLDLNKTTGEKWIGIGSEVNVVILNKNGDWQVQMENTQNGIKRVVYTNLAINGNRVTLSIPISLLGNPRSFGWQLAVIREQNKYPLKESGIEKNVSSGNQNAGFPNFGCH